MMILDNFSDFFIYLLLFYLFLSLYDQGQSSQISQVEYK